MTLAVAEVLSNVKTNNQPPLIQRTFPTLVIRDFSWSFPLNQEIFPNFDKIPPNFDITLELCFSFIIVEFKQWDKRMVFV